VCCPDTGLAPVDRLHFRVVDHEAVMFAFDLLKLNGEVSLEERKTRLARLLEPVTVGLLYCEHLEGDGAVVYGRACRLGCEGIVSKRRDAPYRSGG
jgi:bifunctional non-homologous end joining protein LigD